MKRKVLTIIMAMAVLIIAAMLGTPIVSAADGPPTMCTDGMFTVTPAPGQFPRAAEGSECNGLNAWVWEYIVAAGEKELQNFTKIHAYIPSLPPFSVEVIDTPSVHVYDRGEGAQATSTFGNDIYNGNVITITPVAGASSNTLKFSFCTDISTVGTISISFDLKNDTPCVAGEYDDNGPLGGIVGPGFGPSSIVGIEVDKKLGFPAGGVVCAKKHPVTGCIKYFYACDDTSKDPIPLDWDDPPEWFGGFDGVVVDAGNLENPICRETIVARKGSPIQYGYYSNGKFKCLGIYDPDIPSYTPSPPAICQ